MIDVLKPSLQHIYVGKPDDPVILELQQYCSEISLRFTRFRSKIKYPSLGAGFATSDSCIDTFGPLRPLYLLTLTGRDFLQPEKLKSSSVTLAELTGVQTLLVSMFKELGRKYCPDCGSGLKRNTLDNLLKTLAEKYSSGYALVTIETDCFNSGNIPENFINLLDYFSAERLIINSCVIKRSELTRAGALFRDLISTKKNASVYVVLNSFNVVGLGDSATRYNCILPKQGDRHRVVVWYLEKGNKNAVKIGRVADDLFCSYCEKFYVDSLDLAVIDSVISVAGEREPEGWQFVDQASMKSLAWRNLNTLSFINLKDFCEEQRNDSKCPDNIAAPLINICSLMKDAGLGQKRLGCRLSELQEGEQIIFNLVLLVLLGVDQALIALVYLTQFLTKDEYDRVNSLVKILKKKNLCLVIDPLCEGDFAATFCKSKPGVQARLSVSDRLKDKFEVVLDRADSECIRQIGIFNQAINCLQFQSGADKKVVLDGLLKEKQLKCELITPWPVVKRADNCIAVSSGVWSELTSLFLSSLEARVAGLSKDDFALYRGKNLCSRCFGMGMVNDDFIGLRRCLTCEGGRLVDFGFRFNELSPREVLLLKISDAAQVYCDEPGVSEKLNCLSSLGLGHFELSTGIGMLNVPQRVRLSLMRYLNKFGGKKKSNLKKVLVIDSAFVDLPDGYFQSSFEVLKRLVKMDITIVCFDNSERMAACADNVVKI
ncbi:MAG: hypothetical protein D6719_08670 [Candidatus Dadabacteria bacterium]|nr:MAG: hypothetical protein D6719_08670 [Candidatus Dadabacteria bacterium]